MKHHAFRLAVAGLLWSPLLRAQYPAIEVEPIHHVEHERDAPPTGPRFGEAGEFVVMADLGVSARTAWYQNSDASSLVLRFMPSLDYFFMKDVFVGAEVDLLYSDVKGYFPDGSLNESKRGLVGAGPHVGVNFGLGRYVSLVPRVAMGVHRIEESEATLLQLRSPTGPSGTNPSTRVTWTGPWVEVGLPVLFHVAPRFFVGLEPSLYHDFSQAQGGPDVGTERTVIRGGFLVGGYFGGTEAGAKPDEPPPEPRSRARFGDAHTTALTSDMGLAYARTSYSGVDRGVETFTIAPGFDWFVTDRWSLGLTASYATADIVGFDPSGSTVETKRTTIGFAGRLGVDVRTSEIVSVYPRVAIGYGVENFSSFGASSSLGAAFDAYTNKTVFVSISVPALVHVAGHFFVGAGPYIATDVSSTIDYSSGNRATALGLTTLVGGWL